MAIPSPTIPSSIPVVSAVRLNPTLTNTSFYVYSGEIAISSTETTMISINDIGKRDIIFCLELGAQAVTSVDVVAKIKSNGNTIYTDVFTTTGDSFGFDMVQLILPANTSLEITLICASGTPTWTAAGYGYYLGRP